MAKNILTVLFVLGTIAGGLYYLRGTLAAPAAGFLVVCAGVVAAASFFGFELPLETTLKFIEKLWKNES